MTQLEGSTGSSSEPKFRMAASELGSEGGLAAGPGPVVIGHPGIVTVALASLSSPPEGVCHWLVSAAL